MYGEADRERNLLELVGRLPLRFCIRSYVCSVASSVYTSSNRSSVNCFARSRSSSVSICVPHGHSDERYFLLPRESSLASQQRSIGKDILTESHRHACRHDNTGDQLRRWVRSIVEEALE